MFKNIIYKISRWLMPNNYDDVTLLYTKTLDCIKYSNNKIKLKRSYQLLQQLEDLTFSKYDNPQWMVNRNNTLKLLWIQKFRKYTK